MTGVSDRSGGPYDPTWRGLGKGATTGGIIVITNDLANPRVFLLASADILCSVRAEPRLADFGPIERDAGPQRQTIILTPGDGGPLNLQVTSVVIPDLTADGQRQDVDVTSMENAPVTALLREIERHERYELDITMSPPWPNRAEWGTVRLDTGVEQQPSVTIYFRASLTPRLEASPRGFVLPAELVADLRLTSALEWGGGPPGKVLEATVTPPEMTVHIEEQNGRQAVVLHVPADYPPFPGRSAYAVTVKTDDPLVPELRIPIRAMRERTRPRTGQ